MGTHPLTHPQKRVWYNEKLYPQTPLHNIGGIALIKGPIRLDILEQAILLFIKHNEATLLRVGETEGNPYQYPGIELPQALDFFDFTHEVEPQATFRRWVEATFQTPIPLLNNPLFYLAVFKINDQEMGYLAKFHHIICDGWSILLISQQVAENYDWLLTGSPETIINNPSYLDYIHEENAYFDSPRFTKDKTFWLEKFATLPEYENWQVNELDIRGKRQTYQIEPEMAKKIYAICSQHDCSLASFFTSLLFIYFRFQQQKNDLMLGIPVFNRVGRKNRQTFGMYTSTMPLRVTLDETWSIAQLFKTITGELKASLTHQRYPYDLLVQDLELRQKGHHSLYTVCVNYYNTQLVNTISGFPIENEEIHNGYQLFDLQLVINEWSSRISLSFDYRLVRYGAAQIDDLFATIRHLIDQIALVPTVAVESINILPSTVQQKLLVDFNQYAAAYPVDKTLSELIDQQALLTPHNIAVSYQDQTLTYQQLAAQTNQVARFLLEKGITANSFVGFMAHKELGLLAGILGILKIGAAYIPLDPNTPIERIKTILHGAKARYLLTNVRLDLGESIQTLLLSDAAIARQFISSLPVAAQPHDPVYVIFTSGSTGEPKGVVIEHKGLINYLWWAKNTYIKGEFDIFALHSSLAFDLTVTSLFAPLLAGAQIRLYDSDDTSYALHKVIQENVATIVKLTPSELSLFVDRNNSNSTIKTFIVGGEDLKVSLAHAVSQTFSPYLPDIYNEYGPTETVVGCMIHRYDPHNDKGLSVPIGVPIANTAVYILNDRLQLLPAGATGELYISGDCVGRGYLNNESLTNERFLANPFVPGWRMYKSGDLVRLSPEQTIVYLGRKDDQVKIRGYRIELGEISSRLQQIPLIREAIVVKRETPQGQAALCAYVVASEPLEEAVIRDFLAAVLPDYMIPAHFVFLEALPLSTSGKVNKKALPEPVILVDDIVYLPPSTPQESLLIDIVAKTLTVENIGLNHNFLALGGDSIKAIQVAAKLQQQNYSLPANVILSYPILREMAHYLTKVDISAAAAAAEGVVEPTPILYWFLEGNLASPQQYHQSVLFELYTPLPEGELAVMIQRLLQQHESLNLNLDLRKGEFFYNPAHLEQPYTIKQYDLTTLTLDEARQAITALGNILKREVDLAADCLFQTAQFYLSGGRQLLLFIAHHIIIDGVSWQILIDDWLVLWRQFQSHTPYSLAGRTLSYQAWSQALRQYQQLFEAQLAYWGETVQRCVHASLALGEGFGAAAAHTLVHQLPVSSKMLQRANKTYRTRSNELLLAALSLVFYRWKHGVGLPIWIEGHGRESLSPSGDLSRTIGWFTAIYPVYLLVDTPALSQRINEVKAQLRSIPTGGAGFGVLRYLYGLLPSVTVPLIRFNYLGEWDATLDTPFFSRLDWDTGADVSADNQTDSLMDINILVINQRMEISLSFHGDETALATGQQLLALYTEAIYEVIDHCHNNEKAPSLAAADFDTVNLTEADLDALFD